jgi:hypothetical protein
MPLSEYILLAVLASGGAALPGAVLNTTLDADAIVQPNGGALSSLDLNQETPKKEGRHSRTLVKRGHRHGKVFHHPVKQPRTPKKDGGA